MKYRLSYRILIDFFGIPLVIIAAYTVKFKLGWIGAHLFASNWGQIYQKAQIEPYLHIIWIIQLLWIFTFAISGVYRHKKGIMPDIEEYMALIKGITLASLLTMAITFGSHGFPGSRYVIAYTWLFGNIGLIGLRMLLNIIEKKQIKTGKHLTKTLIIGADTTGQDITESILLSPGTGLQYIGTLDTEYPRYEHFPLRKKLVILGPPEQVIAMINTLQIRCIFVTIPIQNDLQTQLLDYANIHQILIKFHLPLAPGLTPQLTTYEDFNGIQLMSTFHPTTRSLDLTVKRMIDILMSATGLVILAPLLGLISVLIKSVSPTGPVIFSQERTGLNGRSFLMFKFRTMIPNAEKNTGPVMVNESNESRYIPLGQFLRKNSLDELPQLLNILKGDMSLIGPRPERPYFVDEFAKTIPQFRLRHLVKGGLTGWAQINGRSVLTRNPEHKLRYDLYYIKNWSILLDIKILFKTVCVVFRQEEAY